MKNEAKVLMLGLFDALLGQGPGLYHKTYYDRIYGLSNKLDRLSLNTRLGWKGLSGTNTLAYYGNRKLWPFQLKFLLG